jgi:small subunit ribosomal protein S9
MVKEKAAVSNVTPTKKVRKKSGAPLAGATGRRKQAVARVWLRRGAGAIVVNGKDYKDYFDTDTMRIAVAKPLVVCPVSKNYDFQINVYGGGKTGQSHAVKLGIARVLLKSDEKFRAALRQHSLLTVDSRVKERQKYGQKGARAKYQFVKR